MRSLRALAVIALVAVPGLALAEPGHHDGPCKSEVQALCAGVQPGGGRIRECMKQHRAQLSVTCKIAIADRMLEHAGQRGARGEGRIERSGQSVVGGASVKPAGN